MTTDEAFEAFHAHAETECTVQFWMSETPARSFPSLRACVLFLADNATDEPLPDVHVHAADGEVTFNGEQLEALISAARAKRAAD